MGFEIETIFPDLASLLGSTITAGKFGIVGAPLSQDDPDYGALYYYDGETWLYVTDMSVQGTAGIQGPAGPQGTQGRQGTAGTNGTQGNQGPVGNQGNQGPIGPQGEKGFQGTAGTNGTQGNQGPTGLQGTTGTQGNEGSQGAAGIASIWHTEPTDPGSYPPEAWNVGDHWLNTDSGYVFEWDGTDWLPAIGSIKGPLGFQGIQGTTGTQGHQGRQGPVGIQGIQGSNGNQGNQGPVGTGTQGTQGNQGPTGASSTIAGPQGNQGPTGIQGTVGTQGTNGMQGNQGPIGLQGTTGTGAQGNQGPTGFQGNQGPIGPQGNDGNDGTGFSIIYNEILYVDPNGNDVTAVLGDPTSPWNTIEAAFNYCTINSITRYEVYVNPGIYNMNVGNNAIDIVGTVSLHLSPNVKINASTNGTGINIFRTMSGCDFKITGGGRAHSQIYVTGRGLITGSDGFETLISLEGIYVNVDSSSTRVDTAVVEVVNADLRVDNCYLELSTATPQASLSATSAVIKLIAGTVRCKSSTLKLNDQGGDMTTPPEVGSGYAALYSWIIKETQNGSQLHRIMLHQTAMIVESGGGFILTNPGMATSDRSILLDSIYMHSTNGIHPTLWMDQTGSTDTYYVGSNCISGGNLPYGNWLQLPPDSQVPNIIAFQMPTIMPY
jgi:hypothetical protein